MKGAKDRGGEHGIRFDAWISKEEADMIEELRKVDGLSASSWLRMTIRRAHREIKK